MDKQCRGMLLPCGMDECEPFNQGFHLCGVVCRSLCPIPTPHRGPQRSPCIPYYIPTSAFPSPGATIEVQLSTPIYSMLSRGMLRSPQHHIPVHHHRLLYSFPRSLELRWG